MKKLLVGTLMWMLAMAWVAVLPNAVNAAGGTFNTWWWGGQDANKDYNVAVSDSDTWIGTTGDKLIRVVRTAINWVLWMLSLVALVIALYAGFLMMTSGGDEKKYSKWVGLLKWAGIGLAIIALSWLIVSLIFWIINGAIGWGSTGTSA